uniref:Uncharacterized protein n=1 Tax=Magallana gigas TaxID=29159 RepID=A0A8W8J366_MAGGI
MNIIVYRKSNQSLLGSFNFPADSDAPCLKYNKILLSACYADDSMESTVIRCNHQCSIETVECSANCRMEDVLDKSDVLSCLADCKLKSETCDTTCICLTDCASRMKGCGQLCKSHSFQTSHDRRECYAECSYETEQCRNKCNQ